MRVFGFVLIGIGIIYLIVAFNIDVSVSSPPTYVPGYGSVGGGSVANLDLMAQRQNHTIVAALITLVGALMAIFGGRTENSVSEPEAALKPAIATFSGQRELTSDPYRLWLAGAYSIERNEVFDRFVIGEQTFATLEEALAQAHALEMQIIENARLKEERRLALEEQSREEAEYAAEIEAAEWQRMKPKVIVGAGLTMVAIFGFGWMAMESPEERASRQALEDAKKQELVASAEERFQIDLPEDASEVKITEKVPGDMYLCSGKSEATLLEFNTKSDQKTIKDSISSKLGKGKPVYETIDHIHDWRWTKKQNQYELIMTQGYPATEVKFCMTRI